jgi:hypothetical protein
MIVRGASMRAVKCTVAAAIINALACAPTINSAQAQLPPAQLNPSLQQPLSIYENQRMPECTVKWKAYKEQHKVDGTDAFRAFLSDCIGLSGPVGAPDEWKKFLSGQPFIATTPSNLQFRMVLTPNGKMMRDPIGTGGSKGEGTWSLSGNELCTAWAGAKPNCFVLRKKDEHNWSLMRDSSEAAVWTTMASGATTPIVAKTATSSSDSQALEFYALRTRLATLWAMPADSKKPDELVVKIRMRLKPDGILASAPVVLSSGSSAPYVAARDSALRAAFDAQPYSMLKAESYEAWKELEITFDPRGVTVASATPEQAAETEATTKSVGAADDATTGIVPSQQVVAAAHPISLAASSKSSTASDISVQQRVTARINAPERADIGVNERDRFGAAGMLLRTVAVHATLLLAVLGQFVLILTIIFRFSSPPHEKAMRALAVGCGLLVYVGVKAAGISIPDAYRALSTGAISVGTFGVALPFAAGISVAWYSVRTLAGKNHEQNVLGMRILSMVMTYILFLFCDSYLHYVANEKREFVQLLPNFTFVLSILLYAILCYRPHRAEAPAPAQSPTEPEYAREPQRYAGVSFDRRHPAAASESDRFGHRVPLASSREHVSLASAMRTRVGAT